MVLAQNASAFVRNVSVTSVGPRGGHTEAEAVEKQKAGALPERLPTQFRHNASPDTQTEKGMEGGGRKEGERGRKGGRKREGKKN